METCDNKVARAIGLVVLMGLGCVTIPSHASELDPLEIAIVSPAGDRYVEPMNAQIVIWYQPINLCIRIRNTSKSSRMVRSSPERAYSVELCDQAGATVVVKRKRTEKDGNDDPHVNLAPGEDKVFPIAIDRNTWEGVPELVPDKESKFTARIVYETAERRQVYSKPYTLIFRIR